MAAEGKISLQWSGSSAYTLTTSLIASDEVVVNFAKKLVLFPYYLAGTGATTGKIQFTIEFNPFDSSEDPSGLYWAQHGIYTDSSGTWSQEAATYEVGQGTVNVYKAGLPVIFDNIGAYRMRVKIKEANPGGSAGLARVVAIKTDFT